MSSALGSELLSQVLSTGLGFAVDMPQQGDTGVAISKGKWEESATTRRSGAGDLGWFDTKLCKCFAPTLVSTTLFIPPGTYEP